jgi:hypothetical protein
MADLIERLRAADRMLARERLSPGATRRTARSMAAAMARRARLRPYIPALAFAAGAALVLALVGFKALRPQTPALAREPARVATGLDCREHQDEAGALVLDGRCALDLAPERVRLETTGATRVARIDASTIDLSAGEAMFDVAPRTGDILRVRVPGGTIEVVGTRFRVIAWSTGGTVELFEGTIRAVDASGSTMLAPGDRHTFGAAPPQRAGGAIEAPAPPAAAAPEPSAPEARATEAAAATDRRPRASAAKPEVPAADAPSRADALVAEVRALRSAGRYADAAQLLRDALAEPWPPRTADILSYELGTILARHLADPASACAHWAEHTASFPATRYAEAIGRSRTKLGCR